MVKYSYLQRIISIGRRNMGVVPVLILLVLMQTAAALAATAPPLGVASSFAVLAGTSVTNTGITTINGDLGVSPGNTITGMASITLNGTVHLTDATAANAQSAATSAYNNALGQACDFGPFGATDLTGATLVPGVYCYSSTVQNSGILTLDALGDNNAVWVFKIGSTLTTAGGASVLVINGGQNSNVFWQVGSSATLNTNTVFVGNILALTSITLTSGVTVSGRVLALNGTVTLDTNTVSLSPIIAMVKSVVTTYDPVNGTASPKAIPGSEMLYTITVANSGYGVVDNNTTVVKDLIPANMSLCVSVLCSNPPVKFSCSTSPDCGLTYTYAADVTYSSTVGGGEPYTYPVAPDSAGYDANVTEVRINPTGIFNGVNGGSNPSFSLLLKMKIK